MRPINFVLNYSIERLIDIIDGIKHSPEVLFLPDHSRQNKYTFRLMTV